MTEPEVAIVKVEPDYLTEVMTREIANTRLATLQDFVTGYMKEGEDYGPAFPGSKQRTLLKPGADKLCELYGLADSYPADRRRTVEDWTKEPALYDYEITCVLKQRKTDVQVGEGLGSCNSWESKYRWRDSQRRCPGCGAEAIIKGKDEYGGGWVCFKKKGGCGAKFPDGYAPVEDQIIGKIPNPDIADVKNTVLKIACKRAKVAAVIGATRSSGIFTQDLEDIEEPHPHPQVTVTVPVPAGARAPDRSRQPHQAPREPAKPDTQARLAKTRIPQLVRDKWQSDLALCRDEADVLALHDRAKKTVLKVAESQSDDATINELTSAFTLKISEFRAIAEMNQEREAVELESQEPMEPSF